MATIVTTIGAALVLVGTGPLTSRSLHASSSHNAPHVASETSGEFDAIDLETLDGYRGTTPPLRVRVEPDAQLRDAYGTAIPFTGTTGDVAALPVLLDGTYTLESGGGSAEFTIEGTGQVPNDPGPPVQTSTTAQVLLLLVPLAVAGLLLRWRRTRPIALLLCAGAALAGGYALTDRPVSGATMLDCAAVHPDPSTELYDCAFSRGADLIDAGDFPSALRELEASGIAGCHEIAHRLGVRSWLASDEPENEIIHPGYDLCNHAFYHGALYGAALYLDDVRFANVTIDACDIIYPEDGPGGGACAHGVGHSLMVRFGGDLQRVQAACRRMQTGFTSRLTECEGAALMEYAVLFARAGEDQTRRPLPSTPPETLCHAADEPMQAYCYGGLAMATPRSAASAANLLDMCEAIDDPARRDRCVEGVVPEFRTHLDKNEQSAGICSRVSGTARETCARQYAYFSYDQYQDSEYVLSICRLSGLDESVCRVAMGASRSWEDSAQPNLSSTMP